MTNLLNILKNKEKESFGVENDVIHYLLDNCTNSEEIQTLLEDINNYGCMNGQVNHLTYTTDVIIYFERHKEEILELLYDLGIEDVESWEGIEELCNIFPQLKTPEERQKNDTYPLKLNKQDRKYLTYAIFEYNASALLEELEEMDLI